MSKAAERIKAIKEQQIGNAAGKKALIVEGQDDVNAMQALLTRYYAGWDRAWVVAHAGNKKLALQIAQLEPDWLALIDKDEWSAEQIDGYKRSHRNLHILPRFCMENYMVHPAEIWAALPQMQKERIADGIDALTRLLHANLPAWRRHAALWQEINPLWPRLRELGFKDELLRPSDIPDAAKLTATLQSWSDVLNPAQVATAVDAAERAMAAMPLDDFLLTKLYAKSYFPSVVVPALGQLLAQISESRLRIELFNGMEEPADLDPLFARMGLRA